MLFMFFSDEIMFGDTLDDGTGKSKMSIYLADNSDLSHP